MPKIIINEVDNTLPGLGEYSNFSVVVPGYCGKEVASVPFDENGICEISTQEEFRTKIGTLDKHDFSTRIFAVAEEINPEGTGIERYRKTLSAKDFYTGIGEIYTTTEEPVPSGSAPTADKGKNWLLIVVPTETGTENTYYYLTKVEDTEENPAVWDASQKYLIVKSGNEGQDIDSEQDQFGNQIAYELLGLGYPILFKNLEELTGSEAKYGGWGEFLKSLDDKSTYDFRFIVSGYLEPDIACNKALATLAETRGDCIAVLDIPESAYNRTGITTDEAIIGIVDAANAIDTANKYSAFIAPSLCYKLSSEYYTNNKFPGSFHYLACFAHSVQDLNFAEWYAAAGLTRGVSKYAVESTSFKFGESVATALEPRSVPESGSATGLLRAVNIIAKFRNNYLLWGNRTAHKLEADSDLVASHFLNIRQLCTTLKKELYVACRRFTFDPNSDVLWVNFCNTIKPVLEKMKADQGIDNYEIIKVESKQKALLKARVRIVPIEAVEDFEITVELEDSLGDTTVSVSE